MKVFLLACIAVARAFYLPGVAPRTFRYGDKVELKVNKLTSVHTQIPYDYYSMKFCKPHGGIKQANENLGEFLSGDLIENSPYQLHMEQDQFCKILCQVDLKAADVASLKSIIKDEYHNNWIIDNLPAASIVDSEQYIITAYAGGFPVGFQDHKASYVFNHVNIIVEYHPLDDGSRVVGFYVEPFTVKHKFKDDKVWDGNDASTAPPLETCDGVGPMVYEAIGTKQDVVEGPLLFTYDVLWRSSNVKWASRWDIYLSMDNAIPDKIHWFSIVNSLLIVLFLSVMVAMILVRNLHRDILRYNRVLSDEEKAEERDESGWKLVHADVFRPPATAPMLFCVCAGTGVQVLLCTAISIAFAAAGFLSPANRGSLATAVLVLFGLMGSAAGYASARLYKTFKGRQWQRCTLATALLYPGLCFATFLCFDVILAAYKSTGAVPARSLLSLLALWFGVSLPLVFIGAYFGYKAEPLAYPVITSNIPREIPAPQPWYLSPMFTTAVGGILPFGACFVELFFILSSLWMDQYYYVFGFTGLVFAILVVTCCEISIVLCYFQLCAEDYRWWWRSYLASGSTALYVLLYSCVYFCRLEADQWFTYALYFGYMGLVCMGLFVLTGSCGFFACLWFTRKIYASIKVD
ncbi:hypothetical protein M885DRAFT_616123 [Pelagophyceae sp. CCMP2097]|nr:hypothetical protein M885DRAFT_616123 [Pelagophyceae sp. CCMP2097]|mmetsp:Transcript_9793/g.33810  ORF Transcript_9793/g.33810 Transcript_9793/m.33810 type:complete len:634 (-) Transcript_9793:184-2085(-)